MKLTRALTIVFAFAFAVPSTSHAIDSAEVITRARAFAEHPWHCATSNLTASCDSSYESVYLVGDHMGVPYDWGGFMSLHTFDTGIADGLGAGSQPRDGVLSCAVGLDCSGYVSQCWRVGHHTTRSIPDISRVIDRAELKRGDVLNYYDYHVALFSHVQNNGRPFVYESVIYNVHPTFNMGWAFWDGFVPRRYLADSDDETVEPIGTGDNPIVIDSFRFIDTQDTRESSSDVYDYCGASPTKRETGPEYVYAFKLDTPGRLVATVSDAGGVDIDVHVYSALNEVSCIDRNDRTVDLRLDCGRYLLVLDTYSNGTVEYPGVYDLVVDFFPETTACGEPGGYDFLGQIGDDCAFSGNPNLPFCNDNLGAVDCFATGGTAANDSFCSTPCTSDAVCREHMPGGCCRDLGYEDDWCVPAEYCDSTPPDDGGTPDASIEPIPDAGRPDTGEPDTGIADTGSDTGSDAGSDIGTDVGSDIGTDAGASDTPAPPDAGSDSSAPDLPPWPTGSDADEPTRRDTSTDDDMLVTSNSGCAVGATRRSAPWPLFVVVVVGFLPAVLRRR